MAAKPRAQALDCQGLRDFLARQTGFRFNAAARQHVEKCPACQALVSDLEFLAARVRQLRPPEPSPALWDKIRFQLEQEGIIRSQSPAEPVEVGAGMPPSSKSPASTRSPRHRS